MGLGEGPHQSILPFCQESKVNPLLPFQLAFQQSCQVVG